MLQQFESDGRTGAGRQNSVRGLDHVLLERESEVDSVTACLREAARGRGGLVVITGPVGAGKSGLLHALPEHATAEDTIVLRGGGALSEQDFAFGVVHQFLDSALLVALPEARAPWFSVSDESKTLEILHDLVVKLSERHPLLVLVDDVQWADAPSLAWLDRLTKRLAVHRIVVVMTVRDGDPAAGSAAILEITGRATHRLALEPLSPSATEQAVAAEFGTPGEESFVRGCHETSGGRPLFLRSILSELRLRGYHPIAEHAGVARSILPPALHGHVMACLRSQPATVQRFACALAVLNEPDSRELLCAIAGLEPAECTEATETLTELGLLKPEPVSRFFHHAVRDAVEQSISPGEFTALHIRVAEALHECDSPVDEIAAHLLRADPPQVPWAVDVLRAAGRAASGRGDFDAATRYLRRALMNCPLEDRTRAHLLIDLATIEHRFDPLLSAQHLAEALPLFGSVIERGHAAVRIEPMTLGLWHGATLDLLEKLYEDLGDPAGFTGESQEMALRLEARLRYARYKDPTHLADAITRLAGLGDEPSLGTAGERELVGILLFAATLSGTEPAKVAGLGRRILQLEPASLDQLHTAVPLIIRSLIAADSLADASAWLDLVSAEERRLSTPAARTFISVQRALIEIRRGELTKAANLVFYGLDLTTPSLPPLVELCVYALVLAAMETGDAALATRALDRCAEHEPDVQMPWLHKLVLAARATAGSPEVALKYLHACGRELDTTGWCNPEIVPWRSWAAILHFRLGQQAAAEELVEEEYARALTWGTSQGQGRALRVWGTIIAGSQGIDLLTRSAAQLGESGNRLEQARTALLLGERLRGTGHPDAESHLARGRRLSAECGASWLVRPSAAAKASPSRVPRSSLTASERKVAELATTGMTNQLIARKLEITLRTVEKHLTNVYRKLELDGRGDLARALGEPFPPP